MSWMLYTRSGFWLKAISWQRSFTEGWIAAGLSAKRLLFLERTHKEVKSMLQDSMANYYAVLFVFCRSMVCLSLESLTPPIKVHTSGGVSLTCRELGRLSSLQND